MTQVRTTQGRKLQLRILQVRTTQVRTTQERTLHDEVTVIIDVYPTAPLIISGRVLTRTVTRPMREFISIISTLR